MCFDPSKTNLWTSSKGLLGKPYEPQMPHRCHSNLLLLLLLLLLIHIFIHSSAFSQLFAPFISHSFHFSVIHFIYQPFIPLVSHSVNLCFRVVRKAPFKIRTYTLVEFHSTFRPSGILEHWNRTTYTRGYTRTAPRFQQSAHHQSFGHLVERTAWRIG